MKINKENYPAYFLDYHEGRLSKADEAELFVFLGMHPELREAFEVFQVVSLPGDEPVVFPAKNVLKRGVITPENHDWYFAAYVEGDLGPDERKAVEAFVASDPVMAHELALMQKVILAAPPVSFPGKASLKRELIITLPPLQSAEKPAASAGKAAFAGSTDILLKKGNVQGEASGRGLQQASGGKIIMLQLRQWLPYASVAAVILFMAGLFFLRLPDASIRDYSYDIPVVGGADDPAAVADDPLLQQGEFNQEAILQDPLASTTPPATGVSGTQASGPSAASRRETTPSGSPGTREEASGLPGSFMTPPSVSSGMLSERYAAMQTAGSISPQQSSLKPLAQTQPPGSRTGKLSYRTEFAYWDPSLLPLASSADEPDPDLPAQGGRTEMSLAQLAMNRIQDNLPVDFSRAEDHLAENRIPIWLMAEAGLRGLGQVASNALGLERETDEEGRTIAIRAGERFEARRSQR